jgi:IclR family mhp operon transcriptional activator
LGIDDRLLRVLRSLNEIGPCTILQLSRATGISRPAVYRVVDSLCRHGYVQRIPSDSRIRLTSEIRALSAGYRDDDVIVEAGGPILRRLQREVRWPTSLATPDKDRMVVRETTRYRSPFVFDAGTVGTELPILRTALGLAYLSSCAQSARSIILGLLQDSTDPGDGPANGKKIETLLKLTAQRGYAVRRGGVQSNTSSIAIPLRRGGDVVGAMCVTYATSVLTDKEAVAQLLPALRDAAAEFAVRAPADA